MSLVLVTEKNAITVTMQDIITAFPITVSSYNPDTVRAESQSVPW